MKLYAPEPGSEELNAVLEGRDDVFVSDLAVTEIVSAVARAARQLRLVLEPSGAASLAALLRHGDGLPPGARVAILSGGNVDPSQYAEYLGRSRAVPT